MKKTSYRIELGVIGLKNRFLQLYLCSIAIIGIGFFEFIFNFNKVNTSGEFYFGIFHLLIGAVLLVFAITSHVKYNTNRKQLDSELSKEYDERDDLIEGKASHITVSILMVLTILMMFLSKWITIPTNTALFIIIIFCMITNILAKKYYDYVL